VIVGRPVVAVFGSSATVPDSGEYADAMRCGRLLAEAGFAVATGGYAGTMEGVSRGAVEAGGAAIGVTAPSVFPGRFGANRYVTEEMPAEGLLARIDRLLSVSGASIALPGSIGTLAELLLAWNLAFVAPFSGDTPKPVVTVGPGWRRLVADLTVELATNGSLITCVATVDEAVEEVRLRLPQPPG
jgi:uncharacterized protein (TIGR00730 family)